MNTETTLYPELELERKVARTKIVREPVVAVAFQRTSERWKYLSHFAKMLYFNIDEKVKRPTLEQLEVIYKAICGRLNEQYKHGVLPTLSELNVAEKLLRGSRHTFHQGYWIGNRCIDIFFPHIAGSLKDLFTQLDDNLPSRRFTGLAIEVDGSVHFKEAKIKKDQRKITYLSELRIPLLSIPNTDVSHPVTSAMIASIWKLKSLDTRARRRLRRRIYLETILYHATDSEFEDLFGLGWSIIVHIRSELARRGVR